MSAASESTAWEGGAAPLPPPVAMSASLNPDAAQNAAVFVDRRKSVGPQPGAERRQFTNSYEELSPDARELGRAVDEYKFRHHRRFINYEELLAVIRGLGYRK